MATTAGRRELQGHSRFCERCLRVDELRPPLLIGGRYQQFAQLDSGQRRLERHQFKPSHGFVGWGGDAGRKTLELVVVRAYISFVLNLFLIWFLTVLAMEGFAYGMHRWVMHGPGWFLHQSHHREHSGRVELNDLYAVIFALPSVVLIYGATQADWGNWAVAVGIGIATYGLIYFGFHDVIVHRRMKHRYIPKSDYMKRIVQAHRLHHAVESQRHGLSFGFLVAPPIEKLMVQLETSRARLRQPTGRETPAQS